MKKLFLAITLVALTGCSFIMPRPHDPVMFDRAVGIKLDLDKMNCVDKDLWFATQERLVHLEKYASLRKDPQLAGLTPMIEALEKAKKSNNINFCESVLKLQRTRIDVLLDTWKGR